MRENIIGINTKEFSDLNQYRLRQGKLIVSADSFPVIILINEPINPKTTHPINHTIIVPSNADQKLPISTHIQINMISVNKCHSIIVLSSSFIVVYLYYNIKKLFHFSKNFLTFKEKII